MAGTFEGAAHVNAHGGCLRDLKARRVRAFPRRMIVLVTEAT
ncbi:hypothetical protein [Sinorhizobium medicae]|nr:hypothetical protein [Sinorhizobium medicae]